jgi:uncharacterized protein with HEPN domain
MRNDEERLRDILEAIERIERHAGDGERPFRENELVQLWMVHHLQIIGEAVRSLSPQFRQRHPEVPWQKIIGMRNILVHDYFGIDLDIVWTAVQRDVPELKRQVQRLLDPPTIEASPES